MSNTASCDKGPRGVHAAQWRKDADFPPGRVSLWSVGRRGASKECVPFLLLMVM